ncbi:MAG TPA: DUF2064 domain-containing protein [Nannocystaceae bacterium]|nr:DUF2064 domain-containing protein [Nannocystaceae bacterium]
MPSANLVIALARAPVAARMDLRLAGRVDEARSHEPRRADAIAALGRSPRSYELVVAFSPPHEAAAVHQWLRGADRYEPQPLTDDPGRVIASAMDHAFRRGAERVVIVGMGDDDRLVTRDQVEDALQWIEQVDCVLGPVDGGAFRLLGSRVPLHWLRELPWADGDAVLSAMREELVAADMSWCEIDGTAVRVGDLQNDGVSPRPAAPA